MVTSLAQEFAKPIVATTKLEELEKPVKDNPNVEVVETPKEIQEASRVETKCSTIIDGVNYNLIIRTKADGTKRGLYDLTKLPDGSYVSQINLSNKFFDNYDGNPAELDRIIYFIKVLIATEISIDNSSGGEFRNFFNNFFGLI